MEKSRVEKSVDLYLNGGYSCAQAVAVTYCDLVGMDPIIAFKGTEGFGAGMGSQLGTCGAISAASFIAGFANSTGNLDFDKTNKSKADTGKITSMITRSFNEITGSIVCKDLKDFKGEHFTKCTDCVAHAAIIVETVIFPGKFEEQTYFK